jgi:nicotinamide phosphoribosyltransferase
LNFTGSDTMSAAYYAQFELNNGKPVAESIPATEHSVMTSWPSEEDAIQNMIKHFGSGVFAVVMDSYDYSNALYNVLPKIVEDKVKAGGVMVLRPDSGDPVEAVLMGLDAADKAFGHTVNKKGFKVIKNASVIQGDGIDILVVEKILDAVLAKGYAASNVAFGMGGGLLQKVNRDTMSFATKLSYIRYADGREEDVMKTPKTDSGKFSLPGKLQVRRQADGSATIFPAQATQPTPGQPLLKVVYDCRPVPNAFPDSFDQVRDRVNREWKALPRSGNPIGPELTTKIEKILKARK